MIVLDTNVLSELMRPSPAPAVLDWIGRQAAPALFITTITQAEILYGIRLLAPGRRRLGLEEAAVAMFASEFADRILPFDGPAAEAYAEIASTRRNAGRPIAQFDAQIAAIARVRRATVATRNAGDFAGCGIAVANPWSGDSAPR